MELALSHEIEAQLKHLAGLRGCKPEEIVENLIADCAEQANSVRSMLDSRYDDMISGKVKMLSPEEARLAFEQDKSEWLAKRG